MSADECRRGENVRHDSHPSFLDHLEEVTGRISEEEAFERCRPLRLDQLGTVAPQASLQIVEAIQGVGDGDVPSEFRLEGGWLEVEDFEQVQFLAVADLQ